MTATAPTPPKPASSIVEFDKTAAALADLKQRYSGLVLDLAVRENMQVALKGRAELRGYRVTLEKTRVDVKADVLARGRAIDTEAARITAELLALEEPLDALIKAEEDRKENERKEAERKDLERVAEIQRCIEELNAIPGSVIGKPPADILAELERLRSRKVEAAEFQATANNAKARAIAALEQLHAGAVAQEQAAKERAEREARDAAELERLRLEAQQRAREDAERNAQEQQRIVAEGKKRAEEQAAARAKIEAEERASRQRIEEEERAARARREEEDRAARQQRDAEATRLKAEQDARDAAERKARQEREAEEARLKGEREKLEAEQREVARQATELLDAHAMLAKFKERFGKLREFTAVIRAIDALKPAKPAEPAKAAA